MLDIKNTRHSHPSLLPLRTALIAAEKESPARPPRLITADEQRALTLIARMKTECNKPLSFSFWRSPKSLTLGAKSGDFALRRRIQETIHA